MAEPMRIRFFFITLLAAVTVMSALLWWPSAVWAQANSPPADSPIRDELPEESQVDWDRAKDLYQDKKYSGALVQFEKVYNETNNPRVLYNIGVSLKAMKRYVRAIAAWEKQLTFSAKLSSAEVERVKAAIKALKPFVSKLELTTNVSGATLFISGDEIGKTPFLKPIPIDVGVQKIQLRKEGYLNVEKSVKVTTGSIARVKLELEPAKKYTQVRVVIEGAPKATIVIDSIEMGPAPYQGMVLVGRHTVEARAAGFVTARQTSVIKFGKPVNMVLTLVKKHAEGKIKIVTAFEDAVIEVDGKVVGSGAWEGVLRSGGHRLEVRKDGYDTYESDFALSRNQERVLDIKLEPTRGTGWIWWTAASLMVTGGAVAATVFALRPAEGSLVTGTLNPGVVRTSIHF